MSLTEKFAKIEENVISAGPGRRARLRRRSDDRKVIPDVLESASALSCRRNQGTQLYPEHSYGPYKNAGGRWVDGEENGAMAVKPQIMIR